MKQRLFNERPSALLNIGSDIPNAARHRNDTYETPEEIKTKAFKKASSNGLKTLKTETIAKLNEENFIPVINEYEIQKFIFTFESLAIFKPVSSDVLNELKIFIIENKKSFTDFNKIARAFNRLSTKTRRNKIYLKYSEALTYFETVKRESFIERNGVIGSWVSDKTIDTSQIELLKNTVKAVQFGNSVPDSERVYCSVNLLESIKTIETILTIDLKALGFSYGARGNGKSVAFYQDSEKVLSFNRHVDGAFLHELGHAVDYMLDLPSYKLPHSMKSAYREKLRLIQNLSGLDYYMKPKEIFARLFEQYIALLLGEKCTGFMFQEFSSSVMPELNAESIAWLESVLKPIMRGAK